MICATLTQPILHIAIFATAESEIEYRMCVSPLPIPLTLAAHPLKLDELLQHAPTRICPRLPVSNVILDLASTNDELHVLQSAVLERLATSLMKRGNQTWHMSTTGSPHAATCQSCKPSAMKAIQPVVLGATSTAPPDPIVFDPDPLFARLRDS
ncbi:hypothetical protein EDB85DRAFT_2144617 [Lactarius pseudohatsudake]|nr:hypothetical protein EDB85DRAFT_2144617 [Lactarius pseudohatsudake]